MLSSRPRAAAAAVSPLPQAGSIPAAPTAPTSSGRPAPPRPATTALNGYDAAYEYSPLRSIALYAALGLIFVRVSVLPEFLVYFLGVNTYLLYIFAPPAVIGWFIAGGPKRSFGSKPVRYWMLFFGWMIVATIFSYWPGGSAQRIMSYGRTDLLFVLLISGLVINWRDVQAVMTTIAAAGCVNLLTARVFARAVNGRLALDLPFDGIISNSNDLAAHLIFVMCFLLYVALKTRNIVLRVALLAGIAYGISVVLGTASRGALIGIMAGLVFLFFRGSTAQRTAMIVAVPLLAIIMVVVSPQAALHRLGTLFGGSDWQPGSGDDEAAESMSARNYLFKKSLLFTVTHPLFGVGPSQFANYEGKTSRDQGQHGNWHETHCTFTEVSSECGIPGLIFFIGGLYGAFRLVNQVYRKAREQRNVQIMRACLCYCLAVIAYMTALTFLASGYRFTLPLLVGLGVAIHCAATKQLAPTQARA